MKHIILSLIVLAFIGCGNSETSTTKTDKGDVPSSPTIQEKSKVPPSVPVI